MKKETNNVYAVIYDTLNAICDFYGNEYSKEYLIMMNDLLEELSNKNKTDN